MRNILNYKTILKSIMAVLLVAVGVYAFTVPTGTITQTPATTFFADSTIADQGAATSSGNQSIKDFVDAIGATKKATIYLVHTGAADETTYTLTTSETITKYITLIVENGAILDGAGTLTQNGPFPPVTYQVFGNSFDVVFGQESVVKILAQLWGAAPSASDVVNSSAFAAAVKSIEAIGGKLYIPKGTYSIRGNFPLRNTIAPPLALKDYHGLTVEGEDRDATVIHSTPIAGGADVFQLNAVKNVTIRNLSINSTPAGPTEGSNAMSITYGGDNILIENVHVQDMTSAYFDDGFDLNGGSAFSIQHGISTLSFTDVRVVNCIADGGSQGLMYQATDAATEIAYPSRGIKFINNIIKNYYIGIRVDISSNMAAAVDDIDIMIANNTVLDCQRGFYLYGASGVNFTGNNVKSSFPAGNPGFTTFDANKYGGLVLTCYKSNITNNLIHEEDSVAVVQIGNYTAVAAGLPSQYITFTGNTLTGAADNYALYFFEGNTHLSVQNSQFVGNTISLANDMNLNVGKSGGNNNVIFGSKPILVTDSGETASLAQDETEVILAMRDMSTYLVTSTGLLWNGSWIVHYFEGGAAVIAPIQAEDRVGLVEGDAGDLEIKNLNAGAAILYWQYVQMRYDIQ